MQTFEAAMHFRHACKKFDATRQIPAETFNTILNFGRLSPSSFGMEPWRFVVVQTPALREALREACWNQPQVTESSHVVVILANHAAVQGGSEYVETMFRRRGLPTEMLEGYLARYAAFHVNEVEPVMSTFAWSAKQCYLALANMMTGAASLGVDSCPLEGFSKTQVEQLLGVDTSEYGVAVVMALGYRAGEQTPQLRQELAAVVEYR